MPIVLSDALVLVHVLGGREMPPKPFSVRRLAMLYIITVRTSLSLTTIRCSLTHTTSTRFTQGTDQYPSEGGDDTLQYH